MPGCPIWEDPLVGGTEAALVEALGVPWFLTKVQATLWAAATLLFTLLAVVVQPERAITTAFTVGIAALVVTAIAYLFSEFALRPIADLDAYRDRLQSFVYASGTIMKPIFDAAKRAAKIEAKRLEEEARAAEEAERIAREAAEAEAAAALALANAPKKLTDAEKKAARDARYAARKNKKR